jgi:hypothetical protein
MKNYDKLINKIVDSNKEGLLRQVDEDNWEIDREIRLCDVLLAFESKRKLAKERLYVSSKGYIEYDCDKFHGQAFWNLKDDNLDNQNKECKLLLISILL